MKLFKQFLEFLFLTMIMLSYSCENEVDINADYQEISVVYGLLDQSQDRQYVKITKAFQTESNVYLATSDPTISQYDPEDLEVWLDEYNGNTYKKTLYLDSVLITNKDSGDFYFPDQIVYATEKGVTINENYEYRLSIKIKSTGRLIEAQTKMIQDFKITKPFSALLYASFSGSYNQQVEWYSAVNGVLHQLTIRYYYTEVPQTGPTTSHYVDLVFGTKRADEQDGTDKMIQEFHGSSFYQNLESNIDLPEAGMVRYSDSLYYIISVADEDFTIYMDLNGPSNSIVQERPSYTNVGNGIGIFSARYNKLRYFAGLSSTSVDSLISGSYTYDLGFVERP